MAFFLRRSRDLVERHFPVSRLFKGYHPGSTRSIWQPQRNRAQTRCALFRERQDQFSTLFS
jgi:hypothetical protein